MTSYLPLQIATCLASYVGGSLFIYWYKERWWYNLLLSGMALASAVLIVVFRITQRHT